MNKNEITRQRLLAQQITSSFQSPLETVRSMGAMQAQDYYGALWALGLRTGRTQKEIIAAIEAKQIVRTWPQRGTLHFVPAEDAKWMVGLSAARLLRGATRRREQLGLDDVTLEQCKQIFVRALSGGKNLSRPKLMEELEQAGISTKSGRGYHILWYLSQTGLTVIAPMRDKQQTFALLDEWIPHTKRLSRQEAIATLTQRYFMSHGPATVQDFAWWSGLTIVDIKYGLAENTTYLTSEIINGKEYWFKKYDKPMLSPTGAFLLPGFDEYILGYKDRSAALPTIHTQKIVPGSNGMFLSSIVIDGQIVGTWRRTIKKDSVLIELSPFMALTKRNLALIHKPAAQYGQFLGLKVELVVSI